MLISLLAYFIISVVFGCGGYMFDADKINKLVDKICSSLPGGVMQLPENIKNHFKATLTAELGKLNVITQEEFQVQTKVLQKTREKLAVLEDKIAKLEQQKK